MVASNHNHFHLNINGTSDVNLFKAITGKSELVPRGLVGHVTAVPAETIVGRLGSTL